MKFKKFLIPLVLSVTAYSTFTACNANHARVASRNLSQAADSFEVNRRVVFINGITDKYVMTIEGLCSVEKDNQDNQLEVTCKTGPTTFKKHFLGLSDNLTYFIEHLEPNKVSVHHYRVIFKPSTIIPDVDIQ